MEDRKEDKYRERKKETETVMRNKNWKKDERKKATKEPNLSCMKKGKKSMSRVCVVRRENEVTFLIATDRRKTRDGNRGRGSA